MLGGVATEADDADSKTGNEWIKRSREGRLCSIFGCEQEPLTRCQKCANYYCNEHFESHAHVVG